MQIGRLSISAGRAKCRTPPAARTEAADDLLHPARSPIPLADPVIRRYGSRHEHAFEQDHLVVGSLTAAGSCVCA